MSSPNKTLKSKYAVKHGISFSTWFQNFQVSFFLFFFSFGPNMFNITHIKNCNYLMKILQNPKWKTLNSTFKIIIIILWWKINALLFVQSLLSCPLLISLPLLESPWLGLLLSWGKASFKWFWTIHSINRDIVWTLWIPEVSQLY